MTIDEAIKHCEEVAESEERKARLYQRPNKEIKGSGKRYLSCIECANEHRQLTKWLKELKEFKVLFVKANRDVGNVHLDNRAIFEKFFWEVWKIFDVTGLEEVNADEEGSESE